MIEGSSWLRLQSAEPQAEQKSFENPLGGAHAPTRSSPWVTFREPGAIRAPTEAAVPERCWQRVQWQYPAGPSGSVISKRTPPHMQLPVSIRAGYCRTGSRAALQLSEPWRYASTAST